VVKVNLICGQDSAVKRHDGSPVFFDSRGFRVWESWESCDLFEIAESNTDSASQEPLYAGRCKPGFMEWPYQFSQPERVKLAEQGSTLYLTDVEAAQNQPRMTDAARKEFLANLRLQMERQDADRTAARIWEIDPSELVGDYLGGRLRLCTAPDCACRLLIGSKREQARKTHPICTSNKTRENWRLSKRNTRANARLGQPLK
jgi:hypothetical protein